MADKINSFRGEHFFLSNFFESKITVGGITYRNAEAAFQAQKCSDEPARLAFAGLAASDAKRAGRRVSLRRDWESVKFDVMREVVLAKFSQNEMLKSRLLATGDIYLEEGNTWGDRTWGAVNGYGLNMLGKILMETREKLRNNN